ncbi:CAP family protein [Parerythrobacter lacustris]|uniref:CAP family protein n=1 Tax=Parerythrobacter lacustris TaxID=2969984 RepID=A0ABT1XTW8_9SPHN|nr:CAP family protein [Parerythrobacter lacustris]
MLKTIVLAAAICALLGGNAVAEAGLHPFDAELLRTHNEARSDFGAKPLRWNEELANDARAYAKTLARQGRLEHAPAIARRGAGENLWQGTDRSFTASDMIGRFVEEKRWFKPGRFPDVSTTGNWVDVGHYTQIVWPSTEEVGCAVASNARDEFLVCRYRPAGNIYDGTIAPQ